MTKSLSIMIQHIDKGTEEVKRGCTRNIAKIKYTMKDNNYVEHMRYNINKSY